jgi:hypothetical protein
MRTCHVALTRRGLFVSLHATNNASDCELDEAQGDSIGYAHVTELTGMTAVRKLKQRAHVVDVDESLSTLALVATCSGYKWRQSGAQVAPVIGD